MAGKGIRRGKMQTAIHIVEYPSPTDYPWDIYFRRDGQNVTLRLCGARGGLKAIFSCRLSDLKGAVEKLEDERPS